MKAFRRQIVVNVDVLIFSPAIDSRHEVRKEIEGQILESPSRFTAWI